MTRVWLLFLFGVILCMEIIPERIIMIGDVNHKYVRYFRAYVRRAGRGLPYMINAEMSLLYTIGNNVSIDLQFFEYLHNEYKPSFIHMKFKACEILTDYLLGGFFEAAGMECPLPAGNHSYYNLTFLNIPVIDNLPYKWPFEKGKVLITIGLITGKELLGQGDLFFTIKEAKKSIQTVSKKGRSIHFP